MQYLKATDLPGFNRNSNPNLLFCSWDIKRQAMDEGGLERGTPLEAFGSPWLN